MLRAFSLLTDKQQVLIYYDQERGELCRNPSTDEHGRVRWERHRASNALAAFAVERRLGAQIQGEYRNQTLRELPLTEEEIEGAALEALEQQKGTGGP